MTDARHRLATAPFEVVGRFAAASNATLLVRFSDEQATPPRGATLDDHDPADLAVYKPERGEAPLWDFPQGTLHRREVAAYVVSEALGWDLVPTTVLRAEGPFGRGSLQRFVPHDPDRHYFTLIEEAQAALLDQLRAMVIFDLVIDNADRKGGHVLVEDLDGVDRVRLIDHGVSFNVERKLRTVAWEFADEPIPADLLADVARLCEQLDGAAGAALADLLEPEEVAILRTRIEEVLRLETFPPPVGPRPFPWPLL